MNERRPVKTYLTADFVRSALSYDPERGLFRWRQRKDRSRRWNTRYAGTIAGQFIKGYRCIQLEPFGGAYRAPRLAWLIMTGEWPPNQVDHINGVRHDDRWKNLRSADNAQNNQNRGAQRNNQSSGFRGVSYAASMATNKWQARIVVNGELHRLGYFATPEEAAAAYRAAADRLHGEFARAN